MNENSINEDNGNKITNPYILEIEYTDGTKKIAPYVPIANVNKIKCGNKNIFFNTDTMCMAKRPLQDFLFPDMDHGQSSHPIELKEQEKIKNNRNKF